MVTDSGLFQSFVFLRTDNLRLFLVETLFLVINLSAYFFRIPSFSLGYFDGRSEVVLVIPFFWHLFP